MASFTHYKIGRKSAKPNIIKASVDPGETYCVLKNAKVKLAVTWPKLSTSSKFFHG